MICHKVGKIPDELPNHIFFPLLVQDGVILLQHRSLVFFGEHQRRVLQAWGKTGERVKAMSAAPIHCNGACSGRMCSWIRPQAGKTLSHTHTVEARQGFSAVLALDDGLLVRSIPVLELGIQLQPNHFQVPWVMVPGEVAVHTDNVHVRCLW